uniref:Uncharacterized protein n=1 Tax=Davidia involucrata TaxID=16924 RepID=A0A5B6Z7Y8_DAVIN
MGGCATKPKELKAEAADTPAPAPAPAVKEEVGTVSEATKEVVVEGEVVDKDKEIVQDDAVDEQGSRRRSLSHLFKEKEGKDSTEIDKTALEPVKQEEQSATEKAIDVDETKPPEAGKAKTMVEQTTTPVVVVVDAPVKAETEKEIETRDTLAEKANEAAPTTEKASEAAPATETQKPETLAEEKKTVEEKPVAETETHGTDEKKEEK